MRPLLPISHSPEREVEPRRKLFRRQLQLLAQRPHSRHTSSTRKLRLGRWRSIRVRNSGSMTLLIMASKARQSVFGDFFGLSLSLVILPFFMRLRSSCGYDANDVAAYRISDEEHSPVDQTAGVEAQLAGGIEIIKLDHIGVQEHLRRRSEVDAVLRSIRIPLRAPTLNVLIIST
jgi:hypothetical protein